MVALSDFKKGQTVYVVVTTAGGTAKGSSAIVRSVGRKYVTLDERWARQFYVNDSMDDYLFEKTDFRSRTQLYRSEEIFLQCKEKDELRRKITCAFSFPYTMRLSLDQLRRIDEILKEDPSGTDTSDTKGE